MPNESNETKTNKALPGWVWGLLILLGLSMLANYNRNNPPAPLKPMKVMEAADSLPVRSTDTMTAFERTQYQADPSSAGFSQNDREFFKEHGVSESEARAAETILREHGQDK